MKIGFFHKNKNLENPLLNRADTAVGITVSK